MNIEIISIYPDSSDRKNFEKINDDAFPLSERKSFDEIFYFASDTNTDVLGIYDNGNPIGFAVLLKNTECGYINYFAIDYHLRSNGYGSAAIQKILEMYSEIQLVLDFEVINENAENNEQRIRRKNFYLKNGFHETGHFTMVRDEYFEVVCSDGELHEDAFRDLIHILHKHRPEFPDVLV